MSKGRQKNPKKKVQADPMGFSFQRWFPFMIVLLCGISFSPILHNDFINFDDPQYVSANPFIRNFSGENLHYIFSHQFVGNYQPVTILFYALEFKFAALKPGGYHLASLLLHILNAVMVLMLSTKILKSRMAGFVTAVLFAVHPLHVESVAWVASQKDLLYTFFGLLSLHFFLRTKEEEQRKIIFLSLSVGLFILSVLCKAQAVVLPAVFLLVAWYMDGKILVKDLLYTAPLFLMALIFGLMAMHYQKEAGAMQDFDYFTKYQRVQFASYGFVWYVIQGFAPFNLCIFYPYPEFNKVITSDLVGVAPFIVMAVFALVLYLWLKLKSRITAFGFFFFVITIALVIQLIPVGDAIHADRYTYLSLLGPFMMTGYFFDKYFNRYKNALLLAGALIGIVFAGLSYSQCAVWKDSITVYSHSLESYPAAIIYSNRGAAYFDQQKYQEAFMDFNNAIELKPNFPNVFYNRGLVGEKLGKKEESISDYTQALVYNPNDYNIYIQRGNLYKSLNRYDEGINDFANVIRLHPNYIDAYAGKAEMEYAKATMREDHLIDTLTLRACINDMQTVVNMKPDFAAGYSHLADAYRIMGDLHRAIDNYTLALKYAPEFKNVLYFRSTAWELLGEHCKALADAEAAQLAGVAVDENYLAGLHAKCR